MQNIAVVKNQVSFLGRVFVVFNHIDAVAVIYEQDFYEICVHVHGARHGGGGVIDFAEIFQLGRMKAVERRLVLIVEKILQHDIKTSFSKK